MESLQGKAGPVEDAPSGMRSNRTADDAVTRGRRVLPWILVGVLAIVAVAAVGWAGVTVLRPSEDPLEASTFTTVSVEQGEVGSSMSLNTVATWQQTPVGTNRVAGVVTSVEVEAGQEVTAGQSLYTVDLRPVVIAQGTVPSFRDIALDTTGADVAQLQTLLGTLGFYSGMADGNAGSRTVAAIKAWQKSLGLAQTGVVSAGDIIVVPSLPARVTLNNELIAVGGTLGGGELLLNALPESPEFTLSVTSAQAASIPEGTRVEITSPDADVWEAFAGGQDLDAETQNVMIALAGKDGGTICGDACGQIPVTGDTSMLSQIITTETVSGLVVPSAALVTTADGEIAVIDESGTETAVEVIASAQGMSVIDGVDEGTRVRVPAEASS